MALSKEQLRKIYGVTEPTDPPDPKVLARRSKHEAAAKWCARWVSSIYALFSLVGFIIIFLPTIYPAWLDIVTVTPFLSDLFKDYAHLRGIFRWHFYFIICTFAIANTYSYRLPEGNVRVGGYSGVVAMEIYPTTKKTERAFFVVMTQVVLNSTAMVIMPWSVMAFFIIK